MNETAPPTFRGHVLVVDAQRTMRGTISLLLSAQGYTVLEADTHDKALAELARGMDLMLVRLKSMNALEPIPRAVALRPYLRKKAPNKPDDPKSVPLAGAPWAS